MELKKEKKEKKEKYSTDDLPYNWRKVFLRILAETNILKCGVLGKYSIAILSEVFARDFQNITKEEFLLMTELDRMENAIKDEMEDKDLSIIFAKFINDGEKDQKPHIN